MPNILMITPEGKEIEVPEEHFETATGRDKFEPAFEYVNPKTGSTVAVRKSHTKIAEERDGLIAKPLWDAKNDAKNIKGPSVGANEAFGRGIANSATMGFADELSGAGNALASAARKGSFNDIGTDYRANRDSYREQDDDAWKNQKSSYGAGYTAAVLPTLAGGAAKFIGSGAKELASMGAGQIAKRAAAEGAVQGLGGGTDAEGQADLTEGEYGKAALQTGIGGAGGAVLGGVGQKFANGASKNLGSAAETLAYRAAGPMQTDLNKMTQRAGKAGLAARSRAVGRNMLDDKIVPWIGKRGGEAIETRTDDALNKFSQMQKGILQRSQGESPGVRTDKIVARVQQGIDTLAKEPGTKGQADLLQSKLDDFRQNFVVGRADAEGNVVRQATPIVDFDTATNWRRSFKDAAKFQSKTEPAGAEAAKTFYRAINNAIDDEVTSALGNVGNQTAGDAYKALRMKASRHKSVQEAIESNAQREIRNKIIGLTDTGIGGAVASGMLAAGQGGLPAAVAAGGTIAAKKVAENYGDAFSARALDAAAKMIEKYGFEEGMRRITRALGPDAAAQISQKLGGPKK